VAYLIALMLFLGSRAHPVDRVVAVRGFGFRPDSVTVPTGTRVVWTNADDVTHTVTPADSTASFGGPLPGKGDTLSVRFATPGRHPYFCARHPFMTGVVIVTSNTEDHQQ
jgi:plastocyanin